MRHALTLPAAVAVVVLAATPATAAESCPAAAKLRARVAKLAQEPERAAALLRRAVAGQGCETLEAMHELVQRRQKLLARAYPDVEAKELESVELPEGMRLPYGVALARRGRVDEIVPALILESRYFSSVAEHALWRTYLNGYGEAVSRHDPRIREFILELSKEGVPRMQFWESRIYGEGLGVPKDPVRGERLLVAAATKLDDARLELGRLRMDQGRFAEARDLLAPLAAANPEDASVLNALADLYLSAAPPVRSCEKGKELLVRAGDELGDAEALLLLAVAYRSKDAAFACFEKSAERSLEYLRKAAARGNADARELLEKIE